MNPVRTLHVAIVAATLFGAAGFVLAQAQAIDAAPGARAADAPASVHGAEQAAAQPSRSPERG